jgi:hypothetical protein
MLASVVSGPLRNCCRVSVDEQLPVLDIDIGPCLDAVQTARNSCNLHTRLDSRDTDGLALFTRRGYSPTSSGASKQGFDIVLIRLTRSIFHRFESCSSNRAL